MILETAMRHLLIAPALLVLAACGGGGGGSTTPTTPPGPVTVDIPPSITLSGWGSTTGGGALQAGGPTLYVGDLPNNDEARAIVTFPITGIPAGATVTAAELRIVQEVVQGTPYASFSWLAVESVDLEATFEAADLFGSAALSLAGALSPFTSALETKTLDVLSTVLADRTAARDQTSLRFFFAGAVSLNGVADRAGFSLPSGDPTQMPMLRVTYQP